MLQDTPPDDDPDGADAGGGGIDLGQIFGLGCFSEVATANVQHKGPVVMKNLQVGDKVLTSSNTYQPIYSFGHYNPTKKAEFLQVHTQDDAVLELTAEHLVFLKDQEYPVRADSLKANDSLLGQEGVPRTITKINKVQRQGLYTPFTADGTIVVEGIVASSYVSLQEGNDLLEMKSGRQLPFSMHDYIHMGMSPFRMYCLGVSSNFCTSLNEEGIPPYAALSIYTSQLVFHQNVLVQGILLAAFLLVYIPLLTVEAIFGPALAPLACLALAAIYYWSRTKNAAAEKSKVQ